MGTTNLDLTTFSLGPIGFGSQLVVPLPGLSQFSTFVDLRSTTNLIVAVNASLNKTSGIATWTFSSLDPSTGLAPTDPTNGFLPPDLTPPQGDGQVVFSVLPKSALSMGQQISNSASVIFDANAPLVTPAWTNSLDNSPPLSACFHSPRRRSPEAGAPDLQRQLVRNRCWLRDRDLHNLCLRRWGHLHGLADRNGTDQRKLYRCDWQHLRLPQHRDRQGWQLGSGEERGRYQHGGHGSYFADTDSDGDAVFIEHHHSAASDGDRDGSRDSDTHRHSDTAGGGYTSVATTLTSGSATINILAGSLATGSDTLTVSYNGDSNYLAGTGTASETVVASVFSLAATAPAAVNPGTAATSTVTVNTTTGYAGTVTITCALTSSPTGATHLPTCSNGSSTVTLSGTTTTGTATVTVGTTAATTAMSRHGQRGSRGLVSSGDGAFLAFLLFLWIPARRRNLQLLIGMLVVMVVLGSMVACGGGGGGGGTTTPGTTAGMYTFTVTGTGSPSVTPTPTITFTLAVN